ncbi:hypothetical protein ACFQ4O_14555 [Methylopila musalis]|uniref:DUF2783 domain-containing protein n=1 Tax=Methylopila musalis TaxID=1134781 RepID=A0ABW3ZB24_9HYPH
MSDSLSDRLLSAADDLDGTPKPMLQILLRMAAQKLTERAEQIERLVALVEKNDAGATGG